MGLVKYLGSLIKNDTGNSSRSFTLVLSALISFVAGLVMCSVIAYDGFKDGIIDTDLERAGIFMLCMGAFMVGSGVPKIFGERSYFKNRFIEDYNSDDSGFVARRRVKKENNLNSENEEGVYDES